MMWLLGATVHLSLVLLCNAALNMKANFALQSIKAEILDRKESGAVLRPDIAFEEHPILKVILASCRAIPISTCARISTCLEVLQATRASLPNIGEGSCAPPVLLDSGETFVSCLSAPVALKPGQVIYRVSLLTLQY